MERRDFLKGVGGFFAAMAGFKALPPQKPPAPAKGFVFDFSGPTWDEHLYVMEQGVLLVEGSPAFVVQGICLQAFTPRPRTAEESTQDVFNTVRRSELAFQRVCGPYDHACRFLNTYGDVTNAKTNTLKLGISRTDNTPLWIELQNCVLTSIGVSVMSHSDKPPAERMWIADNLNLMSAGEPRITTGGRTAEVTPVAPEEISRQVLAEGIAQPTQQVS